MIRPAYKDLNDYISKLVKSRGITMIIFSKIAEVSLSQAFKYAMGKMIPPYSTLLKIKDGLSLTGAEWACLLNYCQLSVLDKWRRT